MINNLKLFSFVIIISLSSLLYASEPTGEPDIEEGRARIRIWREALPENVGHVSLATKNSYISLWPSSVDRESIATKGISYAVSAVACNVENYDTDLTKEGSEPSFVFDIAFNSSSLDIAWRHARTLLKASRIDDNHVELPAVTWLAPSVASSSTGLRFNCASAVLCALEIGGLNINSFFRDKMRFAELTGHLRELVSATEEKTLKDFGSLGFLYGVYSSIIKPSDIRELLTQHIEDGYKHFFSHSLTRGELNLLRVTEDFEKNIVLSRLLEARTRNDDKYHEYILSDFQTLGCVVTQSGTRFSITLSTILLEEIQKNRDLRETLGIVGIGVLGGVAVAGGVALATDGKCSIM